MKEILSFLIVAGIIGILLGCTSPEGEKGIGPSPTQFLVLPVDAQGELTTASSLRIGPGLSFDEIDRLPQGTIVHIIGTSADTKWYLTEYDNSQGLTTQAWISAESVDMNLQVSQEQSTSTPKLAMTDIYISTIRTTDVTLASSSLTKSKNGATKTLIPINTLSPTSTLIIIKTLTNTPTGTPSPIAIDTLTPTTTAAPHGPTPTGALLHVTLRPTSQSIINTPTKRPSLATLPPILPRPTQPPIIVEPTKPPPIATLPPILPRPTLPPIIALPTKPLP